MLQLPVDQYKTEQPVYIGVGYEGEIMERVAKLLYANILAASPENPDIHFQYFGKLNHGDTLHLAVYDAFEKLFKKE